MSRGERESLIVQSLLYPGGFLSPLEIEDAVTRALAEDLGRAGDVTSIATIPAGTPARAVVVARKAGTIAGLPLLAACFRACARDRDHGECPRRRHGRRQDRADDHRGPCPRRALGRARGAQLPRPPVRHLDRDARLRRKAGAQDPHLLHAQDHAGASRSGEIRGALRRRLQSSLRPRRRHPDQGQPRRCRGRHPRRAGARARRAPATWSRSRSRSTRSISCRRCSTAASPTSCCSTISISR